MRRLQPSGGSGRTRIDQGWGRACAKILEKGCLAHQRKWGRGQGGECMEHVEERSRVTYAEVGGAGSHGVSSSPAKMILNLMVSMETKSPTNTSVAPPRSSYSCQPKGTTYLVSPQNLLALALKELWDSAEKSSTPALFSGKKEHLMNTCYGPRNALSLHPSYFIYCPTSCEISKVVPRK